MHLKVNGVVRNNGTAFRMNLQHGGKLKKKTTKEEEKKYLELLFECYNSHDQIL